MRRFLSLGLSSDNIDLNIEEDKLGRGAKVQPYLGYIRVALAPLPVKGIAFG